MMTQISQIQKAFTDLSMKTMSFMLIWTWIGFLFWSYLLDFFSGVYYLNLATLSINTSISLLLLFFLPSLLGLSVIRHGMNNLSLFFLIIPSIGVWLFTITSLYGRIILQGIFTVMLLMLYFHAWFHPSRHYAFTGTWSLMSSLVLIWVIRYFGFSINYAMRSLLGVLLTGVLSLALFIIHVLVLKLPVYDSFNTINHDLTVSPLKSDTQSINNHVSLFHDLAIAVAFAFLFFLTHWLFTSYGVIPRWVGLQQTRLSFWISLLVLFLGIIFRKASFLKNPRANLIPVIGAISLAYLTGWLGFLISMLFLFYLPSLWDTLLPLLKTARPGRVIPLAMLTYLISALISVFTVVYDYVPFGHFFRSGEEPLLLFTLIFTLLILYHPSIHVPSVAVKKPRIDVTQTVTLGFVLFITLILVTINFSGIIGLTVTYNPETQVQPLYQSFGISPDKPLFYAMTYNIQQGYDNQGNLNLERVASIIQSVGASIIGLQETDTLRISTGNMDVVEWLGARLGMYAYEGPSTRDSSFGNGLLSYYPILQASTIILPSKGENAVLITAVINIHGVHVNVLVAHFGESEDDKQQQAQKTANIITGITAPLILLGDFNAEPQSTQIQTILATGVTQAYAFTHNNTYAITHPGSQVVIDHIFIKGLTILQAQVYTGVNSDASDHLPVYTLLTT